ncbi:MAG: hypothetical protein ACKVOA_00895 [Methylophilaceae bacterium]
MLKKFILFQCVIALIAVAIPVYAAESTTKMDAVTDAGEKVVLFPDGHWEYVDQQKAAVVKREIQQKKRDADCPPEAREGLFGCLLQNDKAHPGAPHGKVYHSPL